ncbi:unnamed protein product [Discosporangium mesarthrocarpum]
MERMNPRTTRATWKIAACIVALVVVASAASSRAHDNERLPRKHILKYVELLRSAAEHSIRASQDSHPVNAFIDPARATMAVDIVENFLTPDQARHLTNVDLADMKEFVDGLHEVATQALLKAYAEKTSF